MKRFYLLDGHAQIFRAFFAPFRELTSPSGESVKAIYVFTQLVLSILRQEHPAYLAVAFDVADETTKRKAIYPEYKEHRDATPDELHTQLDHVKRILAAMDIPMFEKEGYEADDLIATVAKQIPEDVELRIVSKDKDLHQILTERVRMWDPKDGSLLDATNLEEKKGYTPAEAVEVQTLMGDSTDNVPGVPGVGPKTGIKLIKRYGTAENVVAHAAEQSPKLAENLAAFADTISLTRQLVTLEPDAPFTLDLEACVVHPPDPDRVAPLFEEFGFRTFLEQLADLAEKPVDLPSTQGFDKTEVRILSTDAELEAFAAELVEQPVFALDTETTSLQAVDCDVVGLVFSWRAGQAAYLPVRSRMYECLLPDKVVELLSPILTDPDRLVVGHNLKYDLNVLRAAGIEVKARLFDTMVASAILAPDRRSHGMDNVARDELGHEPIPISDLIGKGKNQVSMLDIELAKLADYAAEDGDVTWRLYERFNAMLERDPIVSDLFWNVEMPLVRVLADMEYQGVRLDVPHLEQIEARLQERIEDLTTSIHEAAGEEFNPGSTQQLAEILFTKLEMPVVKKGKTQPSTDASVLETLAADTGHPLPALMLEYRELTTLLGTFVTPLPTYVSDRTGRIHASFHQAGTATGRISSSDPNIQNIPVRTEAGREIRAAFVPREAGWLLLTADYSQIELRMLAHFSGDEALRRAFEEDRDIHAVVASEIFEVGIEDVTADQRRMAKTVNFGIVYGQTSFGLARTLRIPRGDAQAFIDAYKERYTGIDRFLNECVQIAKDTGVVSTILGRRRAIPQIRDRNRAVRQLGERLAVNTRIQGSAADLIKMAMIRLASGILERGFPARLLIQVHDELVLEVEESAANEVEAFTCHTMTTAMELDVPLKVDSATGPNWRESKS